MGRQKRANAENDSGSCSLSQNTRQRNNTNTVSLTEEIIHFDILTRLPLVSLFESARFVCKSWKAIISDPQFVTAHLRCAKPGLFIQSIRYPYGSRFLEIKDNGDFEVSNIGSHYPGRILNSFDGISVFFRYATGALYVGNPVLMELARVPDVLEGNLMYPPCAIARVPHTDQFKLFAATVQKLSDGGNVSHWYVLRIGIDYEWRKICTKSGDFEFKCTPIYTGGYDLYWITGHRVIVMDVDKETFQEFQLPPELRRHPQYARMGASLSSIIYGEQGFQVHKFDSSSGRWTLYHQIGHLKYPTSKEVLYEFYCFWVNQELIIKSIFAPSVGTWIFGYNMKTRNLSMIYATDIGTYDLQLHTMSLIKW